MRAVRAHPRFQQNCVIRPPLKILNPDLRLFSMREFCVASALLASILLAGCGAEDKQSDLIGNWDGKFENNKLANIPDTPPKVSLNLNRLHEFQLDSDDSTVRGTWSSSDDKTIELKAESRNSATIPAGAKNPVMKLTISSDRKSLISPSQPITWHKS